MSQRGAVLLEMLVAMFVFSVAGTATLSSLNQAVTTLERVAATERRAVAASRILAEYSLLSGDDLGRSIGSHRHGALRVIITRPEPRLYRVAVADTLPDAAEEMATVLASEVR